MNVYEERDLVLYGALRGAPSSTEILRFCGVKRASLVRVMFPRTKEIEVPELSRSILSWRPTRE